MPTHSKIEAFLKVLIFPLPENDVKVILITLGFVYRIVLHKFVISSDFWPLAQVGINSWFQAICTTANSNATRSKIEPFLKMIIFP